MKEEGFVYFTLKMQNANMDLVGHKCYFGMRIEIERKASYPQ